MPVPDILKEILVCPVCKGDLVYKEDPEGFVCYKCKLFYRVEDGIPIMLPEEAEKISNGREDVMYKILFIHGAGGSGRVWDKLIDAFDEDFKKHCIALDLPGHGEKSDSALETVDEYANWLCERVKEMGVPVVVCGHSMGGAIVIKFLDICKESNVIGAILVSTGAKLKVNPKLLEGLKKDCEGTIKNIAKWAVSKNAPEDLYKEAVKALSMAGCDVIYSDFAACDIYDGVDSAKNIKVKTLILVGSDDVMTPPKLSEELRNLIPESKLEVIEGAGHMLQLEAVGELSEKIKNFVEEIVK